MKKVIASMLVIAFGVQLQVFAAGSKDAEYIGGTVSAISGRTEGKLSVSDEKSLSFDYKKGRLAIPYDKVNGVEYGTSIPLRDPLTVVVIRVR